MKPIAILIFMILNIPQSPAQEHSLSFIRVEGQQLINESGESLILKGMAFGNEVWAEPQQPIRSHHSEQDYRFLQELGFNSVRFYLNYQLFEEDDRPYEYKESGFDWLDENIAWARKNGIYLILNMHIPQGGFQSAGNGTALWEERENQNRFIALWREIATRYADEPVVLGYDILNEPFPTRDVEQWRDLAEETVLAIRRADPRHIIIIDRVVAINDDYINYHNEDYSFFKLVDDNILYSFHFYDPVTYTHQGTSWVNPLLMNLTTFYPSDRHTDIMRLLRTGETRIPGNNVLTEESEDWVRLESPWYTVDDMKLTVAVPVLQANRLGPDGEVRFDDITIEEKDGNGLIVGVYDCFVDSDLGWAFYAKRGKGFGTVLENSGRNNSACLSIAGSGPEAVYEGYLYKLHVTAGNSYRISGYAQAPRLESRTDIQLQLGFFKTHVYRMNMNRYHIQKRLQPFIEWSARNNVPLYCGEFGVNRPCLDENRGGYVWLRDVINEFDNHDISYNFHDYHSRGFGLFNSDPYSAPGNLNIKLVELFRELQTGQK